MNDYWPKQALAWLFCPAPGSGTLEYKATLLECFPLKWFNFEDQQLFYAACPSKQHTTTAETSMQVILQKGRHAWRRAVLVVTNTLKIMRATMLLLATSNGVGVNVRLVLLQPPPPPSSCAAGWIGCQTRLMYVSLSTDLDISVNVRWTVGTYLLRTYVCRYCLSKRNK